MKTKTSFPEKPRNLIFEYNLSYMRKEGRADVHHIWSLTIEDRKIKSSRLDGLLAQKGFPFNHDELKLFESGVFGATSVRTRVGIYKKAGDTEARLDALGGRGGNYQIVTLEYHLQDS